MTSNEYFKEFSNAIQRLDADDYAEAIDYFKDYAEDAGLQTGEQLIAQFGTPKQLAIKVLAEHSIRQSDSEEKRAGKLIKPTKKNASQIWLIILAIFSAPIAVPLAIGLIAMLIGLTVAIVAFFGGILVTIITAMASLFFIGIVAIYSGIGLLATTWAVGLAYLGLGLAAVGLGLIVIPALKWVFRIIAQVVAKIFRWFYRVTVGKSSNNGGAR